MAKLACGLHRSQRSLFSPVMPTPTDTLSPSPACDTSVRFVRVLQRHDNGLVAFEFAIGWTELSVELVLPGPAFDQFCQNNQVRPWPADEPTEPHPDDEESAP